METQFKESIKKSKVALENFEKKAEEVVSNVGENASELWSGLKDYLHEINGKLDSSYKDLETKGDEAKLQANLGVMEAKDKMDEVKSTLEEFTNKVSKNAHDGFENLNEKSLELKRDATALWDEKSPLIREEFEKSKESVTKMATEAVDEITKFYEKMTEKLSETKDEKIKDETKKD